MELRYLLAVVTGAGTGLGRELAVTLGRAGCAVLVADRDLPAAEETLALVEAARVRGWALQVELDDEDDSRMLAARARDLGGADLLVTTHGDGPYPHDPPASMRLTRLLLGDLDDRQGRRDGTPAVVNVWPAARLEETDAPGLAEVVRLTAELADPGPAAGARVMAVVPGGVDPGEVCRVVVDLLAHGEAGTVLGLVGGQPPRRLTALP